MTKDTSTFERSGNRRRVSGMVATAIGAAISVLLLLMPVDAQARPKQKMHAATAWTLEPATFMSLPLGGTLPANRQCVQTLALAIHETTSSSPAPCWQGESNVKTFYELQSPGFQIDSVVAVTYNDTIGTIIVNGMRPEYAAMKRYLIATYGQPTQVQMKPMGQQGGMMLNVENLRWDGKYVSIQLEEIYNRVDMFRVIAIHKPSTLNAAILTE